MMTKTLLAQILIFCCLTIKYSWQRTPVNAGTVILDSEGDCAYAMMENTKFPVGDSRTIKIDGKDKHRVDTADKCPDICTKDRDCVGFEFVTKEYTCEFFREIGDPSYDGSKVDSEVSYTKKSSCSSRTKPQRCFTEEEGVWYYTMKGAVMHNNMFDDGYTGIVTIESASKLCRDDRQCAGFSCFKEFTGCIFYDEVGQPESEEYLDTYRQVQPC